MHVQQLAVRFQHLEAMGTTRRNQQGVTGFGTELNGMPETPAGGLRSKVGSHIPHPALNAGDKSDLGGNTPLKMESANGAGSRIVTQIHLLNRPIPPDLLPILPPVDVKKVTAVIANQPSPNLQDPFNQGGTWPEASLWLTAILNHETVINN